MVSLFAPDRPPGYLYADIPRSNVNELNDRIRGPLEPVIIAFGGGGGGVGRSTLALDTGSAVARRARSVLLVDADIWNPTIADRMKLRKRTDAEGSFDSSEDDSAFIVSGPRGRPDVLSLAHIRDTPLLVPGWRASSLIARLRSLHYDYIIIDLPAENTPLWSSLFALTDIPILVATPESHSVVAATSLLRSAIVFGTLHHSDARRWERELLDAADAIRHDADLSELFRAFEQPEIAAMLRNTLRRFHPYLVINDARDGSERDLAAVLAFAWSQMLGVRPRVIAAIDHDERRWFHVRQGHLDRPLEGGSDSATGDNIADAVTGIDRINVAQPRVPNEEMTSPTELLGIDPNADTPTIKLVYRRLWEGFRRDNAVTRSLVSSNLREHILNQLEDANRRLTRWLSERRAAAPAEAVRTIAEGPDRTARVSCPAAWRIRDTRTNAGITQRELSSRTRIGLQHIQAIEDFTVDRLPRSVYLRGYLREIARVLELDPEALFDEYSVSILNARNARMLSAD